MSDALAFTLPPEAIESIAARAAEIVLYQLTEHAEPGPPPSPYMTITEAADYLRCRRQRVDDLLSSGRLTRHKDGSRTLVARDEIERHLR